MVCRFQGVQPATDRVRHVPKTGKHFSGKQECPFSGHAIEDFGPKWPKMAKNGPKRHAHVPFLDILILEINVLPF